MSEQELDAYKADKDRSRIDPIPFIEETKNEILTDKALQKEITDAFAMGIMEELANQLNNNK